MRCSQVSSLQVFVKVISKMQLCGIAFDVVETFLQRHASFTQRRIQQGDFLHHPIVFSRKRQHLTFEFADYLILRFQPFILLLKFLIGCAQGRVLV